jgi:hypothetical protein
MAPVIPSQARERMSNSSPRPSSPPSSSSPSATFFPALSLYMKSATPNTISSTKKYFSRLYDFLPASLGLCKFQGLIRRLRVCQEKDVSLFWHKKVGTSGFMKTLMDWIQKPKVRGWGNVIYCGSFSGSDFEKVSVPVPDPDNI